MGPEFDFANGERGKYAIPSPEWHLRELARRMADPAPRYVEWNELRHRLRREGSEEMSDDNEIIERARASAAEAGLRPSDVDDAVEQVRAERRQLPHFASEEEERAFWATHDSTDRIDWSAATSHPDILGGMPVFQGTRVPIRTLFDYLIAGDNITAFLEDHPTVTLEKVVRLLVEVRNELVNRLAPASKEE